MNVVILTPVYNDWSSLVQLSEEVDAVLSETDINYRILAINDDSELPPESEQLNCDVLHLNCNLGHQRAIAVGLAHLAATGGFDAVVVMDADGEDKPGYLPELVAASNSSPNAIIAARRDRRSEGSAFRFGYWFYRLLFRLFTGQKITFGNFCLIPSGVLSRLVYQENLWNHLAATILKSRFPLEFISTERGKRYQGESSMHFGSLVLLGMSAISVYNDVALLRTLMASVVLGVIAVIGVMITVVVKFFTPLAIPGWATSVVGSLSIIIIQSLVLSVFLLFVVLANRSQRGFIAARHYQDYILRLEQRP